MSKIYIRATRGWVNKFDFSSFNQEVIITNPTQDWSKDTTGNVLSSGFQKIKQLLRHPIFSLAITDLWIKKNTGKFFCNLFIDTGTVACFSIFNRTIIYVEDPLGLFGWNPKNLNSFNIKLIKFLAKFSKFRGFIFFSRKSRSASIKIFGADFIDTYDLGVCHPPLNITNSKSNGNASSLIRLGFISGEPYGKGYIELIEAMKISRTKTILKALVPKKYHEELANLAKKENVMVIFYEWNNTIDISNYFSEIDILVHPTYLDSTGMVILESLANNIPVITSDVYATGEFIEQNKNGVLIERSEEFCYYKPDGLPKINLAPLDFFQVMGKKSKEGIVDIKFINKLSLTLDNAEKIRLFEPIKNTYFNNNQTFADIISDSERRE